MTKEEFKSLARNSQQLCYKITYLNAKLNEISKISEIAKIKREITDTESKIQQLGACFKGLPELYGSVMFSKYVKLDPTEQIAAELNFSTATINRIIKKSFDIIKDMTSF